VIRLTLSALRRNYKHAPRIGDYAVLNQVVLNNFGPLTHIEWHNLGRINLVIGGNGSGKTFLLKALYCAMRTLEEYKRGDDRRSAAEILADKLYWTFQADKIGDLVTKGSESPLSCAITLDGRQFSFSYGKDTAKQISTLENHVDPRQSNSIFLPAKEVLSIHHVILKSREQGKEFGFDDTYLDLVRAVRLSTKRGKNYTAFANARTNLSKIVNGWVAYDEASGRWLFGRGNQRFPIGVTSEGIKKIALLDTLLGNHYLDTSSLIFIDEPEAALHPQAISQFLDIIAALAESGIQFFLAGHSYFVIKKLFLIAQEKQMFIPVLSESSGEWPSDDFLNGMPDNPIINESIRLYEEEVELVLK